MDNGHERAWSPWYLLLLIQFVPALWVPFYNSEPSRLCSAFRSSTGSSWRWCFVSAAVTAVVYFATERASRRSSRTSDRSAPWN